jgi:cobyrinic acid a,c-diamide synthase
MNSDPGRARGLIIGAPSTGSGKTTVTLALSALLARRGMAVSTAKVGPDYIDSAFHGKATGRPCRNLDDWAMRPETIAAILERCASDADLLLIEGVMGLFDGAPDGARVPKGSTAAIARLTRLPVVIVMQAKGLGATSGAILSGLAGYDPAVKVAGVVFNNVSGERHRSILVEAARHAGVPALGFLAMDADLRLPSRHLGLVQAGEFADFGRRLDLLADRLAQDIDLEALLSAAAPVPAMDANTRAAGSAPLPVLGQRMAVASDQAFAFAYPSMIENWRQAGAEILPFSPLADEPPDMTADAVFLPGGYPELHAGRLASNHAFMMGLRRAASRRAVIYGECGGYMTLGRTLIDAAGNAHAMADLLPVVTSFAAPRLHLGYRRGELLEDGPLGSKGTRYRGHEFHYASVIEEEGDACLFRVADSGCRELGSRGRRQGSVMGSFLHLMDTD